MRCYAFVAGRRNRKGNIDRRFSLPSVAFFIRLWSFGEFFQRD